MKRYFINSELKISSIILLVLMALFLFVTQYALNLHHSSLKDDYTGSLGAITVRILDENPELEREIIPLLTKGVSKEESSKGMTFLSQYGLTKELEDELFPNLDKVITKNYHTILLIFTMMCAMLFICNYLQYGFFYKRVRKLTLAAKKVVDGEYNMPISEDKEGDFSKLALSFNSMRTIIKNNLKELKVEKQFLVDLMSDISHQLKTPLSSMIVYNDIMLNKKLSAQQRETFLLNNQNQLHRMECLIKSILKMARLDANAIELDMEEQSLNETVQECIYVLEGKATEANVSINFSQKEEIFLEHDRLWMEEAFINVIKNCIEHTPKGGEINIEVNENPVYRRITIEDTGVGISEDDIPNIFKRFYKAKTSKKSGSIGIGLSLAKSIVESHKGSIEAQSEVGVGTRFIITFLKF